MYPLQKIEASELKKNIPSFKSGDTVRVHCKIIEGDKQRIQIFQGVVIARHNNGLRSTFTVRKVSFNVGVERVFPLYSPNIEKIEVASQGYVRRAKLYYLRNLFGKKARIRSSEYITTEGEAISEEELIESAAQAKVEAQKEEQEAKAAEGTP